MRFKKFFSNVNYRASIILLVVVILLPTLTLAQKKRQKKTVTPPSVDTLGKLRDEYIASTKEYKSSLEKLVAIYQKNVTEAEEKLTMARKLQSEGLIARSQLEENERLLTLAKEKVAETQRQMDGADNQIANVLVEAKADEELARNLKLAKNGVIRTSSFIRFTGASGWVIGEAWKIQRFFSDSFNKPLPIAVFGQGAIHERWRLDHRNAMDISLHPDSVEGQALMGFLQKNGIPFSAFRSAIPGTATGPHIHIGRPSHRY